MLTLVSALTLGLISSSAAWPCGGFFHAPADLAEQRSFQAIFQPVSAGVQADYLVTYQGAAQDFGWVLPIPGEFVSLVDGDIADFQDLDAATSPVIDLKEFDGCMMGASKGDGGLGDTGFGDTGGVQVVTQGFTGTYAYTVLDASSSTALLDWLTEHGWDVDVSGDGIAAYVDEGGWQFVAMELQASHDDPDQQQAYQLPPISLQYGGDRLVYPARLARYGMINTVHTVLYVRGDQRARLSAGWAEVPTDSLWDAGESPNYMQAQAWPEYLYGVGADQGFATVFAGPYQDGWVTRFENRAPPEAFQADADFALDAGSEELHTVISNRRGCNKPAGAGLLLLLLPGLGLSTLRRRRPQA